MVGYKGLIFDLGNVVFKCSFDNVLDYWAKLQNVDFRTIKTQFVFDEMHERFEKKQISPLEYKRHISKMINIEFENDEFENGWNSIYVKSISGIPQLLGKLKNGYRLVALTNTNCIHYPVWNKMFENELNVFEKIFSSNVIGVRKPEKEAYEVVLNYLNLSVSDVIFLDDNYENVIAATSFGIRSILVTSFEKMSNDLKNLGIN